MSKVFTVESMQRFITEELIGLGVEEETINTSLRIDEIDIDSLDVADLMTSIKKDCGVEIPRRDLAGITLLELIERIIAEGASATALPVVPD